MVLIVGAGPVGISVALWCRFFGARHIVVSDLIGARAERAVDFGATAAIDASREDVSARVRQLSGGPPRWCSTASASRAASSSRSTTPPTTRA